ncbi:MAG: SxtJ family membrane protein [Candidatus Omnitrophota bacterium]|nr:SxtJ family membrane protein [Candidatus Omnitrophota bacterium]
MEKLNLDKRLLKKFGVTMALVFLVISGLFFLRQRIGAAGAAAVLSFVFFIAGLIFSILLKPVYIIWMRFAFILGWINTRVILILLFYLVFTPVGLAMKLLKVDLLERKHKKESYWKKKEKFDFSPLNYERRF